ncbi:LuxR C-terminal-related transcriptional regulator [Georgenia sp. MJ170]|uniref:LuxR C-terminal-related transcriptional regulator n=1 Tax=Georgenia sunbinii TaxID=3117728 RepID=UPI002F266506
MARVAAAFRQDDSSDAGAPYGAGRLMLNARLIDRMAAPGPNATITFSGSGSTAAAFVREWARHVGTDAVWLDAAAVELAESVAWDRLLATVAEGGPGTTVVLRLPEPAELPVDLAVLDRLRERAEQLRVVVIEPGRAHGGVLESMGLRPDAVITARELCLTQHELTEITGAAGMSLDESDVATLHRWTGGLPIAVESLLQTIGDHGPTPTSFDRAAEVIADRISRGTTGGDLALAERQALLLTGVPEYFTAGLLEDLLPDWHEMPLVRLLDGAGLLRVVDGARTETTYELPSLVRAALARRLPLEVDEAERQRATDITARWLIANGDLAGAVRTVTTHGTEQALVDLLATHWARLATLPAGRVRFLLTRLGGAGRRDARILVAHVRAIVDITHTGHPGIVTESERLQAALLLDHAVTLGHGEHGAGLATAVGVLRAVLARIAGRHEEALDHHRQATVAPGGGVPGDVVVAGLVQHSLTLLRSGSFTAAATELDRAEGVRAAHPAGGDPGFARALSLLVAQLGAGQVGHLPDPGTGRDAPAAAPRRLAEAIAGLYRLDLAAIRTLLRHRAEPFADPLLGVLAVQLESVAHILSGTPEVGLETLGMAEHGIDRSRLTHYERQLLRLVRAELVLADGDADLALALVDELTPAPHPQLPIPLVRAQALLALGHPGDAVGLLHAHSAGADGSRYRVWALVLTAAALRATGDRAGSDRALQRSLALAVRTDVLLPFARQGTASFEALLSQAGQLDLEQRSADLVVRLAKVRDSLRLLARPVRLTDRERTLLRQLAHVASIRRLAGLLFVSPNTVKSQLRSIYRKLGVSSRGDALAMSRALGLLPAETLASRAAGPPSWRSPDMA